MSEKFYLPWENTIQEAFKENAACKGLHPNFFHPEVGTSTRAAKEVCNGAPARNGKPSRPPCPVRQECLEYALQLPGPSFGVWGGKTERERRAIKKEQLTSTQVTLRVNAKRLIQHGTSAGYESHRRKGQTPCKACKEAHSKATQAWRDRRNDRTTVPALRALVELVHAENARAPRTTEGS